MGGPFTSAAERQAIEAEAARRFLKARAADTDAAWEEALGWVAEHPAHGYAFAKVEAAWELSERLGEIAPTDPRCPLSGRDANLAADPVVPKTAPWRPTRRMLAGTLAASVLAVAIGGTVALQLDHAVDHYRTEIGEKRVVRLADGSVVRLNTGSSIEVALGKKERAIRLLRGEASFDVAHDTARPFIVDADGAKVRAVGTAFSVRLRPDLTEVTVTQGVVLVRDAQATGRRVTAGNAAAVRQGAIAVTPLAGRDIARRLAWQQGRLSFDGDTLAQAVEEFNRYRTSPIVIGDPALSGLRIGGTFRSDRSDDFAHALEQSFGIRALPGADGSLLLMPAAE
ncbi:FecR family protein [Sphingomonas pituitosa]|uniref:FecR family protein n=1 Tax=Sphingomonas pituitosa TaxID=99597 RepID=UPI0009FE051F|nr:FecR domain-containing protein [Sphingomonas pituitosa]